MVAEVTLTTANSLAEGRESAKDKHELYRVDPRTPGGEPFKGFGPLFRNVRVNAGAHLILKCRLKYRPDGSFPLLLYR